MRGVTRGVRCVVSLFVIALVTSACDDDDDIIDDVPEDSAAVRVVHAAPDAPAVDVYVAGSDDPLFTTVGFGEVTERALIPPGSVELAIRPAGAAATTDPLFVSEPITAAAGEEITVVAAGLVEGAAGEGLRLLPVVDEFDPAPAGSAQVRIVHAVPDVPAIDVDVGLDGTFEVEGLEPFATTRAGGIPVPADAPLQVGVFTSEEPRELIAVFTGEAPSAGDEALLVATGVAALPVPEATEPLVLLAVGDQEAIAIEVSPVVFALHASADAPPIDLVAPGALRIEDLAFGEIAGPIFPGPGEMTFDVFLADDGEAVATLSTAALAPRRDYLLVAAGNVAPEGDEPPLQLITLEADFAPVTDGPQLQFAHVSADTPAIDVGLAPNGAMDELLATNLAFADLSPPADVPAAPVLIGVAANGDADAMIRFAVDVEEATNGLALVIGELEPEAGEAYLQLAVVDLSVFPWRVSLPPDP